MMTGEPLFPGESDIDQLFQIIRVVGKLNARHQLLVTRNAMFKGMKQEQNTSLHQMFPDWTHDALDFLQQCLKMDGQQQRPDTATLLVHDLFTGDNFHETFLVEIRAKLQQEMQGTPLLKRMPSYGSGRKVATETKKSGGATEGKKSGADDRFAPSSKLSSNTSQIGLSLGGGGTSKPNSSAAQRRLSTSNNNNGAEETGLNLAALRQYLHQHQKPPQKQMININNLIFKDVHNGHRSRIVSAKMAAKSETTGHAEKAAVNIMDNLQPSTSPVHFQSLQTDSILGHNSSDHHAPSQHHQQPTPQTQQQQHVKRLSPVSVSNLSMNGIAPAPPYFTHRRSSNILGLQQVAAQKSNQQKQTGVINPILHHRSHQHEHLQQQQQQQQSKKRERLIDVALMPLSGPDAAKDVSPRLLPPPWLTGNLKITTQQEGKSVHQIGKRGMTDWKSTAASSNIKPHQHSTTPSAASVVAAAPTDSNGATATPADGGGGFLTDLLLPTCPGATGVSPYKPSSRIHNKLKLSPIMAAPAATEIPDSYADSTLDGRK